LPDPDTLLSGYQGHSEAPERELSWDLRLKPGTARAKPCKQYNEKIVTPHLI